jgi:tetratricopeptide (TPR) repeat protein
MGEYTKARTYLEMQLRVAREMGDLYGESYGCVNLSAVWGALGDYPAARRQAEQALALALKIGDRSGQAWALTYLGHSQLALNQADLAAKSYQRALDIRRELAQPVLATEPLAGLARTALADGDSGSAQGYTDEILAFLENSGSLNGTDDPLRVYFACYQVLASAQDPRARSLLETARTQLIERARKIHDPAAQQVFLSQIEVNRLIEEAWANSAAT